MYLVQAKEYRQQRAEDKHRTEQVRQQERPFAHPLYPIRTTKECAWPEYLRIVLDWISQGTTQHWAYDDADVKAHGQQKERSRLISAEFQ